MEFILIHVHNFHLKNMPRTVIKYDELFLEDLALIINGRRSAGKTTLLFMLLTSNKIDYNSLMIYLKASNQYLYQFINHGFSKRFNEECIRKLVRILVYENNTELDEDDIEDLCEEAVTNHPGNIVHENEKIEIKTLDNINDFQLKKFIVFDDRGKDCDQLNQEEFFQTGRHYKCSFIYLTHRFHEPIYYFKINKRLFYMFYSL